MEVITSVKNPKVKEYVSLVSSAKERRERGLFVLEGLRLCLDVLKSGKGVKEAFFTRAMYESSKEDIDKILEMSEKSYEITDTVADKMTDTKTAQGIFLVVEKGQTSGGIVNTGKYILLENVQDPANLGAVSRTAEALGMAGLIVSGGCDVYSPKALRASMGALLRIPVFETDNAPGAIACAKKMGMKTYASTPREEAVNILDADFSGGVLAVVGNEANGVTRATAESCDESITIKMTGRAESLNAGAAASIIMWEMVKPSNERF